MDQIFYYGMEKLNGGFVGFHFKVIRLHKGSTSVNCRSTKGPYFGLELKIHFRSKNTFSVQKDLTLF